MTNPAGFRNPAGFTLPAGFRNPAGFPWRGSWQPSLSEG
jgi:hypothetical protein